MAVPTSDKLAVLIDADNAQATVAAELMAEVARYGAATVKRAYGDGTTPPSPAEPLQPALLKAAALRSRTHAAPSPI